jgi:hypothetical protein
MKTPLLLKNIEERPYIEKSNNGNYLSITTATLTNSYMENKEKKTNEFKIQLTFRTEEEELFFFNYFYCCVLKMKILFIFFC